MADFHDGGREEANDISAVLSCPGDLVMKVLMGRLSIEETQTLIDHVGKVEMNIGDGLTLLHQAASTNRHDLVHYLCSKGHSTEVKTIAGETPLDQAAWKNAIDAVVALLKHGADVDCQTHSLYTPLHRAAFYDHSRLVALLTLAGADQKLKDKNGQTAYEVAVAQGNESIARTLTPLIDSNGNDLTGIMYATNNPKHPNFRPAAREAFFAMFAMEAAMARGGDDDEDEEEEGEEGEEEEEGEGGGGEEDGEGDVGTEAAAGEV